MSRSLAGDKTRAESRHLLDLQAWSPLAAGSRRSRDVAGDLAIRGFITCLNWFELLNDISQTSAGRIGVSVPKRTTDTEMIRT